MQPRLPHDRIDPGVRVCVRTTDANGATIQPDKLTLSSEMGELQWFSPEERCESCCFGVDHGSELLVTAEWRGETVSQAVDSEAPGCGRENSVKAFMTVTFSATE